MSVKQSGTGVTGTRVATGFTFGYDTADYGGSFSSYTAPAADGDIEFRLVKDTHSGGPAYRLYIYQADAAAWHYIALTA